MERKKRESIDVYVLKDNVKVGEREKKKIIIKKKLFKIFVEIIIFENSNRKWSNGTQTIRILLVRYNC